MAGEAGGDFSLGRGTLARVRDKRLGRIGVGCECAEHASQSADISQARFKVFYRVERATGVAETTGNGCLGELFVHKKHQRSR